MTVDVNKLFEKSNLKWLKDRTIYVTLHGSRAYGTNIATSDIDLKGIALPPKEALLGILDNFEQAQFNTPYDCVIYDIRKLFKLAMDCNPNVIEIIFTNTSDHFISTSVADKVFAIKDEFISKKARFTFAGYAHSQIKRIKTHRRWLLNPITAKPSRSDFNLPDANKLLPEHQIKEINAAVRKKLDNWTLDTTGLDKDRSIEIKNAMEDILIDIRASEEDLTCIAARSLGLPDNVNEAFKRERAYKNALTDYQNYCKWKETRNKARFELEDKFGYDVKHGLHLVRLYRMCEEILTDGSVNVKRPDAEELKQIRAGAWEYDKLVEYADTMDTKLDNLYKTSTLKKEPNRKLINKTLINILEDNL